MDKPQPSSPEPPFISPHSGSLPLFRVAGAKEGWSWFWQSWEVLKDDPGFWILISMSYLVLTLILSALPSLFPLLILATYPAGFLLGAGPVYLAVRMMLRKTYSIEGIFVGFRHQTGPLVRLMMLELWLSILVFVVCFGIPMVWWVNGSGTGGAVNWLESFKTLDLVALPARAFAFLADHLMSILILFSIASTLLITIYLAGLFSMCLVLFRGMSASKAFWISLQCGLQNLAPITTFSIAFLLAGIAGLLAFGVGLLVLLPIYFISTAVIFTSLFEEKEGDPTSS